MSPIAHELDVKLSALDSRTAKMVERLVRDALLLAEEKGVVPTNGADVWPESYFSRTAGALAGETFERPEQGSAENRETW